jgi:peptidyl-prolyl cis-trans isomerase B (cyclophilin B)
VTPASAIFRGRRWLALLGACAVLRGAAAADPAPGATAGRPVVTVVPRPRPPERLAEERIVLRTICGDIVIALYPDVAPQTVQQMIRLAGAGVYDTTHFYRSDPQGYYLQLGDARNRLLPLTFIQQALIHPLPAEWGPLRHVRGAVSLAREPGRPDSALTSFLIIRQESTFLDKPGDTFTIFGRVEQGMAVVDALCSQRHSESGIPEVRLTVLQALVARPQQLPALALRGPQSPDGWLYSAGVAPITQANERLDWIASGGFLAVLLVATAAFWLARRLPGSRGACGLCLLLVSLSGYMLLLLLTPLSWTHAWLGVGLLALTLAIIRLLAFFDS